jgi:hypothetical protein
MLPAWSGQAGSRARPRSGRGASRRSVGRNMRRELVFCATLGRRPPG